MKYYGVLLKGILIIETWAVSPEKAINNARYRLFKHSAGWWDVPKAAEFDVVEL